MALVHCSECGREISSKAAVCIGCGAPLESSMDAPSQGNVFAELGAVPTTHNNAKNNSQMIALAGSAALFFGVFAPLISVPFLGTMNYFQNGRGDGVIILAL